MKTIEATYRIVTPMFIGGADGNPSDGIRPPSFKGALRFWWRALNWGRYKNLAKLHKAESDLFGSAAKDKKASQGVFLLTIQEIGSYRVQNAWPKPNTGAGYLAYGILESKGGKRGTPVPHKVGIEEGLRFMVTLRFSPRATAEQIESICEVLDVIGLLGGLGSRSRRGFGSLSIEREGKLESLDSYKRQLATVFNKSSVMATFTAFHKGCDYKVLAALNNGRGSLETAGGKNKKNRSSIKHSCNMRVSFGLPLQGVDEKKRRASPLFFHVHALEKDQFVTVVSCMPTTKYHSAQKYKDIQFDSVQAFVGGLS